ncbi:MAG: phage tail tape measure protein, partial [Chroococcales cyanobacterium metabat2.561]
MAGEENFGQLSHILRVLIEAKQGDVSGIEKTLGTIHGLQKAAEKAGLSASSIVKVFSQTSKWTFTNNTAKLVTVIKDLNDELAVLEIRLGKTKGVANELDVLGVTVKRSPKIKVTEEQKKAQEEAVVPTISKAERDAMIRDAREIYKQLAEERKKVSKAQVESEKAKNKEIEAEQQRHLKALRDAEKREALERFNAVQRYNRENSPEALNKKKIAEEKAAQKLMGQIQAEANRENLARDRQNAKTKAEQERKAAKSLRDQQEAQAKEIMKAGNLSFRGQEKPQGFFANFLSGFENFGGKMGAIASKALMVAPIWMLIRGAIQSVQEAFKQSIEFMVKWEVQMAKVAVVGMGTKASLDNLSKSLLRLGTAYGISIDELGEGAALWAQQGKTYKEVASLMETTISMSLLSGRSITKSVEDLTAIMTAFGIE